MKLAALEFLNTIQEITTGAVETSNIMTIFETRHHPIFVPVKPIPIVLLVTRLEGIWGPGRFATQRILNVAKSFAI